MTLTYPLVGNYGVPPFTFESNGLATLMESEKFMLKQLLLVIILMNLVTGTLKKV